MAAFGVGDAGRHARTRARGPTALGVLSHLIVACAIDAMHVAVKNVPTPCRPPRWLLLADSVSEISWVGEHRRAPRVGLDRSIDDGRLSPGRLMRQWRGVVCLDEAVMCCQVRRAPGDQSSEV